MLAEPNEAGLETHAANIEKMLKVHKSLAKAIDNHHRTLTTSDDISNRVILFSSKM